MFEHACSKLSHRTQSWAQLSSERRNKPAQPPPGHPGLIVMGHHAFECNFSRALLNQSGSNLWLNTAFKYKAPLHALVAICANATPAEKRAHQNLDICAADTMEQLTGACKLSTCTVLYNSCGRKWGDKRGNTALQLTISFLFFTPDWRQWVFLIPIDLPAGSWFASPNEALSYARYHTDDFCFRVL